MDGSRFDALAKAWAAGTSRRAAVRAALVGAVAALGGTATTAEARTGCRRFALPCANGGQCCSGFCDANGRCSCPADLAPCAFPGSGVICGPRSCPAGQVVSRCRCVCADTGAEPGVGPCPCGCPNGAICTVDGCQNLSSGCAGTGGCDGEPVFCGDFCVCDASADGPLVCSDFGGFDCEQTCGTSADCPSGFTCVTTACCDPAVCVPTCGAGGFLPAETSPRAGG